MLLHCVFIAFRPEVAEADIAACMERLAALKDKVEGMVDFSAGPNRDYEGKSPGHTHGFVITFRSRAALAAYDRHPDHRAAGAWLVASARGGGAGIVVYDIEAP